MLLFYLHYFCYSSSTFSNNNTSCHKQERKGICGLNFILGFNLSDVLNNFVFRVIVTKQSMVKWIIFNDIIYVLENNGKVGNAIRANV